VAVVGTPVGGIVDFLENNETGLFCEPGNPKDIAKQLKKLIEDKNLRNKLILNAKEMVTKTYNWDRIGQKLIEVYKEIL
jgi:glycosyltransferase involved in cell wall biosynthesis